MLNSIEIKFLKYIYDNKKVSYDELLKFSKYSNRDILDARISPLMKYISMCENDSFEISPKGILFLENLKKEKQENFINEIKIYLLSLIKSVFTPIIVSFITSIIVYYLANKYPFFASLFHLTK